MYNKSMFIQALVFRRIQNRKCLTKSSLLLLLILILFSGCSGNHTEPATDTVAEINGLVSTGDVKTQETVSDENAHKTDSPGQGEEGTLLNKPSFDPMLYIADMSQLICDMVHYYGKDAMKSTQVYEFFFEYNLCLLVIHENEDNSTYDYWLYGYPEDSFWYRDVNDCRDGWVTIQRTQVAKPNKPNESVLVNWFGSDFWGACYPGLDAERTEHWENQWTITIDELGRPVHLAMAGTNLLFNHFPECDVIYNGTHLQFSGIDQLYDRMPTYEYDYGENRLVVYELSQEGKSEIVTVTYRDGVKDFISFSNEYASHYSYGGYVFDQEGKTLSVKEMYGSDGSICQREYLYENGWPCIITFCLLQDWEGTATDIQDYQINGFPLYDVGYVEEMDGIATESLWEYRYESDLYVVKETHENNIDNSVEVTETKYDLQGRPLERHTTFLIGADSGEEKSKWVYEWVYTTYHDDWKEAYTDDGTSCSYWEYVDYTKTTPWEQYP